MFKLKTNLFKNLSLLSLALWALSIVIFLVLANMFSSSSNGIYSSTQTKIIITVIIIGVLSFCSMFVSFVVFQLEKDNVKIKKTSKKQVKVGMQLIKERFLIACIIFLLLIVVYFYGKGNSIFLGSTKVEDQTQIPTFSMPTNAPSPSPTPVYVPQYVAPTTDSDPLILCNVHPNCGGGTISLKKSECDNSVCCQIGDKWIFYKDKSKCDPDQKSYWTNYYKQTGDSNYVVPTYAPLPTFGPILTDCKVGDVIVGKMTNSECITRINEYYQTQRLQLQIQQAERNNQELQRQCIDKASSDYQKIMAILRANGSSDSSTALQAEGTRRSTIDNCVRAYPVN